MAHLHIPVATAEEDNIVRWLSALSLQRAAAGCILAIPNIRDVIIPHCTPATLIRLSWTCRTLYQVIQDYFTLAYNINEHLRPFFDDPIGFRSLQARTGALISGSNALQFFAQVRYEESDLDIYVKSSKVLEVGNWLMNSAGYRFEPNGTASNQAPGTTFVQAVLDEDNDWEYAHDHPEGVYTFYKVALWPEAGLRKVQVVSAIDTPMALILKFYSTHLMNLISYDRAYSLYPIATFECRIGLLTKDWPKIWEVKEKYAKRGWDLDKVVDDGMSHIPGCMSAAVRAKCQSYLAESRPAAFSAQPRWIADRHSWNLKLGLDGVVVPAGMLGDPCYASSWQLRSSCAGWKEVSRARFLRFGRECTPEMSFTVVTKKEFANEYVTMGGRIKDIMYHVARLARQLQSDLPLVEEDRFGDDELFRACQAILADRGAWRIWYPPEVQKS